MEHFDATAQDIPLGRHITSEAKAEFVAMSSATPEAANARPLVGPILISEIMYHPTLGQDEYIELYNAGGSSEALFLTTNSWRFSGAINYVFPPSSTLAAESYALVVGMDPSLFRSTYSIPISVPIFGPYVGALGNEGDSIILSKPGAAEPNGFVPIILVEEVDYNDKAPWSIEADGSGYSLQRTDEYAFGNDPASWRALGQAASPGGPSVMDSNGDGLPDVYQLEWFGSTNAPNTSDNDDFDNDGDDNETEFISGSVVTNAQSRFEIDSAVPSGTPSIIIPSSLARGPGYFGLTRMYGLEGADQPDGIWTNIPSAGALPASGAPLIFPYPTGSGFQVIRGKVWLE